MTPRFLRGSLSTSRRGHPKPYDVLCRRAEAVQPRPDQALQMMPSRACFRVGADDGELSLRPSTLVRTYYVNYASHRGV